MTQSKICSYCLLKVYDEYDNQKEYHDYCFVLLKIQNELVLDFMTDEQKFQFVQKNLSLIQKEMSASDNKHLNQLAEELNKFKEK